MFCSYTIEKVSVLIFTAQIGLIYFHSNRSLLILKEDKWNYICLVIHIMPLHNHHVTWKWYVNKTKLCRFKQNHSSGFPQFQCCHNLCLAFAGKRSFKMLLLFKSCLIEIDLYLSLSKITFSFTSSGWHTVFCSSIVLRNSATFPSPPHDRRARTDTHTYTRDYSQVL